MKLTAMWESIEPGDRQMFTSTFFGLIVTAVAFKLKLGVMSAVLGAVVSLFVWWYFVGKPKYTAKGARKEDV